ncbi:hypothetical protein BH11ACT3_BH11ACT3_15960 [soil metagenome]
MRASWSLPIFATLVSLAFVVVSTVTPHTAAEAEALAPGAPVEVETPGQVFAAAGSYQNAAVRDEFTIVKLAPVHATAPATGIPDPGTAQAIAYDMVLARGWGQGEYDCLVSLWNRESHWNVYAANPTSGAYGIPQALPGDKMASAGADWATNPATQITWGLGYIAGRYSTPCGAWGHSELKGWY